jgi:hypothetical protein
MLIVSYGGGVNSTAMLIEMVKRDIRPDLVTFADTGGERSDTYRYIERFDRWLGEHGMSIDRVCYAHEGTVDDSLEEECLRLKILPSIAFGFRTCSQKWKRAPQEQAMKRHPKWLAGEDVTSAIGIDAGEAHRAAKVESAGRIRYRFPLVEWGMDRDDCHGVIADAGLCEPPKSSCFFCPAMKKGEVVALKDNEPELFKRACAIEANAQTHTVVGLGRHWTWAALGAADDAQARLLPDVTDDRMPCACFDG